MNTQEEFAWVQNKALVFVIELDLANTIIGTSFADYPLNQ
jgi:hypothetical protein